MMMMMKNERFIENYFKIYNLYYMTNIKNIVPFVERILNGL